jgi:hypothetical protein
MDSFGNLDAEESLAEFWLAVKFPAMAAFAPDSELVAMALRAVADFKKLRRGKMDFGIWGLLDE